MSMYHFWARAWHIRHEERSDRARCGMVLTRGLARTRKPGVDATTCPVCFPGDYRSPTHDATEQMPAFIDFGHADPPDGMTSGRALRIIMEERPFGRYIETMDLYAECDARDYLLAQRQRYGLACRDCCAPISGGGRYSKHPDGSCLCGACWAKRCTR
jgi:hypothetical protein